MFQSLLCLYIYITELIVFIFALQSWLCLLYVPELEEERLREEEERRKEEEAMMAAMEEEERLEYMRRKAEEEERMKIELEERKYVLVIVGVYNVC